MVPSVTMGGWISAELDDADSSKRLLDSAEASEWADVSNGDLNKGNEEEHAISSETFAGFLDSSR